MEIKALFTQILVLWIVLIGIAWMFRGSAGGWAVVVWPVRTALRLIRRAVGSLLVALGHWVRGGGQRH